MDDETTPNAPISTHLPSLQWHYLCATFSARVSCIHSNNSAFWYAVAYNATDAAAGTNNVVSHFWDKSEVDGDDGSIANNSLSVYSASSTKSNSWLASHLTNLFMCLG